MSKIKFQSGNVSVELNDSVADAIQKVVDKVLPNTRRQIQKQLGKIEDNAKSKWLVREEGSKNSKGKMYSEVTINSKMQLLGNVGNKADYSWAIRTGEDTQQTGLASKKRIANELLWKPTKKGADKIAETLADETIKLMK